jgi:putative DNA primase/helicase
MNELLSPELAELGEKLRQECPPTYSDEALALRFAERHVDELRYVAAWSKWLIWNGQCWQFDDTLKAFDYARKVCRGAARECEK